MNIESKEINEYLWCNLLGYKADKSNCFVGEDGFQKAPYNMPNYADGEANIIDVIAKMVKMGFTITFSPAENQRFGRITIKDDVLINTLCNTYYDAEENKNPSFEVCQLAVRVLRTRFIN